MLCYNGRKPQYTLSHTHTPQLSLIQIIVLNIHITHA